MKLARDVVCSVVSDFLRAKILESHNDATMDLIQSVCCHLPRSLCFTEEIQLPSRLHSYILAWKILLTIPRIAQHLDHQGASGRGGASGRASGQEEKEMDLARHLRHCVEGFISRNFGKKSKNLEGHREFLHLLSVCAHVLLGADSPSSTTPSSLALSSSVVEENMTRAEKNLLARKMKEWENGWSLCAFEDVSSEDLGSFCQHVFVEGFASCAQLSRDWYQFLDRGSKIVIEKMFCNRYSHLFTFSATRLLRRQIEDNLETENFRVSILGTEVRTFYQVDEMELSLIFQVPALYPLQAIEVQVPSCRMGVNESQW
eukprot:CAMPEP_0201484728 /NCGR_PEP_ID=MMETSP0151_2-20130828/8886_1 /ASSEMBLY_ACC=CAM_ASM_000257 /TAXON_ID=200890 /ORGANISM="Paramoeba atlantica, Strain 621/1 / CCAP 1560/9" /LENGTH=315 /DNA_ID=CAMNT_0047868523 /DNA_START=405 /DNA_END=1349 /DNA_ORIENTATION=+